MTHQHPARWLFLVVMALVLIVPQVAPATGVSARVPGSMTTTGRASSAVSSPQPCTPNDGTGVSLTGPLALTSDGNAITGIFANSSTCPQEVGLASYQVQGILLGDQFLVDAITTTLQPAIDVAVVTATLTVQLPPFCRYQVDAFYGDVIPSDGGFPNYGTRAIGARLGTRDCSTPTPAGSATDTPTGTPTPAGSVTETPTTTPAGSATDSPTPTETPQEGTATSSPTGSASNTPTVSASATATTTATPTASDTSSPSATATATPSDTASPSPTTTATPSDTASPSATTDATDTPSPTGTGGIPRATATDTATATPSPTGTTSGNQSPAATSTSTATNTPSTTTGGIGAPSSNPLITSPSIPSATATPQTTPHVFKKTNTVEHTTTQASTTLRPTSATIGTKVTVTGHGFVAGEQITLALDGEAVQTTSPVIATGASGTAPHVVTAAPNGTFSVKFVTPAWLLSGGNTVSAIGNVSHELSASTLTGHNLPTVSQLYFAGGVESASTHAAIAFLNTGTKAALARLTFYNGHGKTLARQVTIPRQTQLTVPVAALVGRIGAFGLALKVDHRVAAQIDLSRLNGDGDTVLGHARLGTAWYLAEGSTRAPFSETLALLNPSRTVARVQLRLIPSAARKGRTLLVRVPAHAQLTVNLKGVKMPTAFGIAATSDHPVVVERTLAFGRGGYGLMAQAGAHAAATTWLFAEGDTTHGMQTSLAILNPGRRAAHVTAEFRAATGKILARRTIVVAAGRRATMAVQAFLHNRRFAAIVTGTQPIVVERSEYTGAPARAHTVGSVVFGLNGPAAQWTFPLGDTGRGYSESLLLYNPFRMAVRVDALVYQPNGFVATKHIVVPSRTQYAMSMNGAFRHLSRFHGVVLRSTLGVVCEQIVTTSDHTSLRATQGLAQ